jgi:hypothetical protein
MPVYGTAVNFGETETITLFPRTGGDLFLTAITGTGFRRTLDRQNTAPLTA